MAWKTIPDSKVRHIWAWPDGSNEIAIDPSFYAENGTPVVPDDEGVHANPYAGDDMIYVRTEIDP
jgi:hypothetical protein